MAFKTEDSYGQSKFVGYVPFLYSKVVSMFLTLPNTSVQAEVNGEKIHGGGGYGLEIAISYHFYGDEKDVNWLKNRLDAIDKNLVKDIKH